MDRVTHSGGWRDDQYARSLVLNRATVGIIGAGHVGRKVIEYLRNFEVKHILLYDPYLTVDAAAELGVIAVSLPELLRRSDAVSLHAPALPTTYHMLGSKELALLRDGTVLINTSRGQNIDEEALVSELERGRLMAFLDVTDPEPPALGSRLRSLPNVVLTPHVSGGGANNRMGDCAVEEVRRFLAGEPALYEVRQDMIDRMA
jgi:phosphoglycerate dehydrogenase-like enzyme